MANKWWLVSDEALTLVHKALNSVADGGLGHFSLERAAKRARHELTIGTHVTDAVPGDFEKKGADNGSTEEA